VTTLVGTTGFSGHVDGTSSIASFGLIFGLEYLSGYVYVSDCGNACVRQVSMQGEIALSLGRCGADVSHLTGTVTTLAGGAWGQNDGVGTNGQFSCPYHIKAGTGTYLYLVDKNYGSIRKIDTSTGRDRE
jgi:hypothetical protein